jgi:glutaredoxin-like protein NrdH
MSPVIVHTKKPCVQCDATKRKLVLLGIGYIEEPLTEETAARFKRAGHLSAPIVTAGAHTWSGYQPTLIEAYAATLNGPETPEERE